MQRFGSQAPKRGGMPRSPAILAAALSVLVGCLVIFPGLAGADIYRYVDKDGVTHFTNIPTHSEYTVILKEKRIQFKVGRNPEKFEDTIQKTSEKYGMDSALIKAVIKAESNFNPTAVSRVGAKGLMQLMPGTAYDLRVADSFHPEENIDGGVRYLRYLLNLFKGNLHLALAAYNAGEKAVYRHNGIPPYQETRTYIQRVLHFFQRYSDEGGKSAQQDTAAN
jgi:soluble lytic murein transglycosylase-like protein